MTQILLVKRMAKDSVFEPEGETEQPKSSKIATIVAVPNIPALRQDKISNMELTVALTRLQKDMVQNEKFEGAAGIRVVLEMIKLPPAPVRK